MLNTAVALSTIFQKNEMIPDHIQFDSSYSISLIYGDITVQLGKDENLEEKDEPGGCHSSEDHRVRRESFIWRAFLQTPIPFEEEKEPVTAENWNAASDEQRNCTGDGEYDENGNYVGARPRTALDEAIENWNGGYDEEGDYTGEGEYDADGNYVGPKPTQESLDAASGNTDI